MDMLDEIIATAKLQREGDLWFEDRMQRRFTVAEFDAFLSAKDRAALTAYLHGAGGEWIFDGSEGDDAMVSSLAFRIVCNPNREGWGQNYRSEDNVGKVHYYRPSNSGTALASLCGRRFELNQSSVVFSALDETDDRLCRRCLALLHPEKSAPSAARHKVGRLEVSYQVANGYLQAAIQEALKLFETWSVRRRLVDELWYAVYHRKHETGGVCIRFVHRHQIGPDQVRAAKKAHRLIWRELQKQCGGESKQEAERVLNLLSDSLQYSGYALNENNSWIQMAK